MTMERNTYIVSTYIDVATPDVVAYLRTGEALTEYTLRSRMQKRIDDHTWLGTASGYQSGLYYQSRVQQAGDVEIVEWHCGAELGTFHHVYPMVMFPASYFGSSEAGTYYHWVSCVDPDRATPMINEGILAVHTAEARSLKGQLEKRAGHKRAVEGQLELAGTAIYIAAPADHVVEYLGSAGAATDWGYLLRREGDQIVDEYDNAVTVRTRVHPLAGYWLIDHDVTYAEGTVRSPILVIPAAFAFAQPEAKGCIMVRVSTWPTGTGTPRTFGKRGVADYMAEAINAKRILEAKAGNLDSFAKGGSYLGLKTK